MDNIDKLKCEGLYREAGAAAYERNPNFRSYGCHFGMRSERDHAMREFYAGFDAAARGPAPLENIARAFTDIAEMAHEWAEDLAGERGRDYDAVRARLGERNVYFRDALEEMSFQASYVDYVDDLSFEIEF